MFGVKSVVFTVEGQALDFSLVGPFRCGTFSPISSW